ALPDPLGVAGGRQLAGERLAELGRDRGGALREAQGAQQIADPLAVASQARDAVVEQGAARDVVRDEGIAVPVTADPRAELEERRHVETVRRIRLPQGALELV